MFRRQAPGTTVNTFGSSRRNYTKHSSVGTSVIATLPPTSVGSVYDDAYITSTSSPHRTLLSATPLHERKMRIFELHPLSLQPITCLDSTCKPLVDSVDESFDRIFPMHEADVANVMHVHSKDICRNLGRT